MKKFVLLITVPFLLVCTSASTGDPARGAIKQTLLCGAENENWAWGYHHDAKYIDNWGSIYSANYVLTDSTWATGKSGVFSEEDIQRLLKKATKSSRKISWDTLMMIRELIKPASEGKYSERANTMFDAGAQVSFAFLFDPVSQSYKRFDLSVKGDWTYKNTSESAQRLDHLLNILLRRKPL